jgi:hypothetical protein
MAEIGGFTSDWRHGTAGAPTVLTDFSAKTMSVTPDEENEEKEFSVFGTAARQYIPSYTNGTIEVEYIYDATIRAQLAAIKSGRTTVDFQLGPLGTATDDPKMSGSMIMTKMSNPVESGEIIIISVSWRITGTVTDGVFA